MSITLLLSTSLFFDWYLPMRIQEKNPGCIPRLSQQWKRIERPDAYNCLWVVTEILCIPFLFNMQGFMSIVNGRNLHHQGADMRTKSIWFSLSYVHVPDWAGWLLTSAIRTRSISGTSAVCHTACSLAQFLGSSHWVATFLPYALHLSIHMAKQQILRNNTQNSRILGTAAVLYCAIDEWKASCF